MGNENMTQDTYGYVFLKSKSLRITEQIELHGCLLVMPFGLMFNLNFFHHILPLQDAPNCYRTTSDVHRNSRLSAAIRIVGV